MPGGNKNINGNDGVKFELGNKAAEKWTEEAALLFANDLLTWMKKEDENIFFDDFVYLVCDESKYAGEIYAGLLSYLAGKFSSFSNILQKCKEIEKIKLKKYSAFDKINGSIAKFLLSAEYGISEKQNIDHTTGGEKITPPIIQIVTNDNSKSE